MQYLRHNKEVHGVLSNDARKVEVSVMTRAVDNAEAKGTDHSKGASGDAITIARMPT